MDQMQQPMIKFWTMTIKSPKTANAPNSTFDALLKEVVDFCYSSSGLSAARHEFWEEDKDNLSLLVLFTGYPTLESNLEADRQYVASGFIPKMAEWVESRQLIMSMRKVEDLPLDSERISFEIADGLESGMDGRNTDSTVWLGSEPFKGKDAGDVCVKICAHSQASQGSTLGGKAAILRRRVK